MSSHPVKALVFSLHWTQDPIQRFKFNRQKIDR